jgi:hypothetical protein
VLLVLLGLVLLHADLPVFEMLGRFGDYHVVLRILHRSGF